MTTTSTIATNARFHAASDEEKRRMIARDAIQQLMLGKYRADSTYVELTNDPNICRCCGIGACLVSMERINDPSKSMFTIFARQNWNALEKYFGEKQLAIIEEFFERSRAHVQKYMYEVQSFEAIDDTHTFNFGGIYTVSINGEEYKRMVKSMRILKMDRTEKLIQIMENIVRNGKFDPEEEIEFQKRPAPNTQIHSITDLAKTFNEEIPVKITDNKLYHEI